MELLDPQIIFMLLALGACAGFLAGLLGIGGGVIMVPLFMWVFPRVGFAPELAVHCALATSLAIIVPTSISSSLAHRKRGNVDWTMVGYLTLGGFFGSIAGSSLAAITSGDVLKMCFGLLQITISLKLLFFKAPLYNRPNSDEVNKKGFLIVGCVGGFIAAFFGIGGGVIAVPLMLVFLRLPIQLAVGNSSALIVVSSLAATCGYIVHGWGIAGLPPYSLGYVNLLVAAIMAPVTIICARLGVRCASKTSQAVLVRVFAVLLLFVGAKILFKI